MSLMDHQTRRDIISPFLLIGRKNLMRYAVNTESFRRCQDWLLTSESIMQDYMSEQFRKLEDTQTVLFLL